MEISTDDQLLLADLSKSSFSKLPRFLLPEDEEEGCQGGGRDCSMADVKLRNQRDREGQINTICCLLRVVGTNPQLQTA